MTYAALVRARLSIEKRSSSAARATPSHAPTGTNVIGFATAVTVNVFSEINKVRGVLTGVDTPRTQLSFLFRLRLPSAGRSAPLVPLKQIPRIDLICHVRELVAPTVGDDHVAASLEGSRVVGHLRAEELWRVQRRPVDYHRHALGLHALQNALDGARAEVIEAGRCQAACAPDRSFCRRSRDDELFTRSV